MKKCPVCGKEFLPAPQHSWLIGSESCPVQVCGYTCQRKSEKSNAGKRRKRTSCIPVKIVETGEVFRSISECAAYFGVDGAILRHRLRTNTPYKNFHIERVVE